MAVLTPLLARMSVIVLVSVMKLNACVSSPGCQLTVPSTWPSSFTTAAPELPPVTADEISVKRTPATVCRPLTVPSFIDGSSVGSTVAVTEPGYPAATTGIPSVTDPGGAIVSAGSGSGAETLSRATSPFLNGRTWRTLAGRAFGVAPPKDACAGNTWTVRSGGEPPSSPSTFQFL